MLLLCAVEWKQHQDLFNIHEKQFEKTGSMKTKFVLTFGLFTLFAHLAMSQGGVIAKADAAYVREKYSEAAKLCENAYDKLSRKGGQRALKKKGRMAFMTAECYRNTERYREANDWYHKCVLLEYENEQPEVLLLKGDMLLMMREYEEAKEMYEKYKALVPDDERGQAGIESCEQNANYIENKGRYIIENQVAINKGEFDMSLVVADRKKSKMVYTSARDGSTGKSSDPRSGEAYTDIWVTELDKKGNFTEPKLLDGDGINTVDNEGTACFDERFKNMFFTRCPNLKKENLGCEIWVSEAKGKTWGEPKKLELKSNDTISVGHPCTKDGKFLIFSSDMPGGFGGKDLWYTNYDRKSDAWSAPENMGPEINTRGDELFPSFALNGDLFFATNGRPGLGGLDIFRASKVEGEENKWEKPTNIGAPINGEHNDYSITELDERHGYFTSERKNGTNPESVGDIYSYEIPPFLYSLKVIVSDLAESERLEGVEVNVTGADGSNWTGITDENGAVFWDRRPTGDRYVNEDQSYTINIKSIEGYYENEIPSDITTIDVNYHQDFVVEMGLFPKRPIRLPEVRYYLDKWTFVVDSTINSPDSLEFVYKLLNERPELVLELSSHTDSRGSNNRNQKLSENRARACYKYLVEERGIDPRRIVPIGKGENEPRTVYLVGEDYRVKKPGEGVEFEEIQLTEAYINQFRRDKKKFEMLHQLNRRTEGAVRALDFDPKAYPEADSKYKEYIPYP